MALRLIKRFFKELRSNIITGVLLIIPLFVTVIIIIQLFQWIDSALPGIIGVKMAPGLGILFTLFIAYFAGLTAKNYLGKKIIAVGNDIIGRIPLLNKIYQTVQQIVDMISINKKQVFERVVLVEFPKPGNYAIGFITSRANSVFSLKVGQKLIAVYIPNAITPTQGFLQYVPESELIDVNIPVETAFKLVVSGGILSADQTSAGKPAPVSMTNGWKWTDLFTRRHPEGKIHDPRD